MGYLNNIMLIYNNDGKIFNQADPKKAATMAVKEFRKWHIRQLDDVLPRCAEDCRQGNSGIPQRQGKVTEVACANR